MVKIKVPLGIFWDIEDCPVPPTLSASGVAKQIRDFIADKHPECGYALEFVCACDVTRIERDVIEGLNMGGLILAHVFHDSKNVADDKLKEMIDMYIDKNSDKEMAVLCVITGDINFAYNVRNARRKNFDVVVIHGTNHSIDLKNLVRETYLFDDIIGSAVHPVNDSVVEPAVLKHPSVDCGGQPDNSMEGTVSGFCCKDQTQRCLHRINQDIFRHKGLLSPVDDLSVKPKNNCTPTRQKNNNQSDPKAVHPKTKSYNAKNKNNAVPASVTLTNCPNNQNLTNDKTERKSIITGMDTKHGESVCKSVRLLVKEWNDKDIHPEFVGNVVRDTKFKRKDGKAKLFVTATSVDTSKALVSGAKKYLKGNSIKWYYYGPQEKSNTNGSTKPTVPPLPQNTPEDDCKSVLKGLTTTKDQNVLKAVRKLVKSWKDPEIKSNFIVNVERWKGFRNKDGMAILFITATSPKTSAALVANVQKHLKDELKWEAFERKKPFSKGTDKSDTASILSKPGSSTNDQIPDLVFTIDHVSVIYGLMSKVGENIAKKIRKKVMEWGDKSVNGNFIKTVFRMIDDKDKGDGIYPLVVVANAVEQSETLVSKAQIYIEPQTGINWVPMKDIFPECSSPQQTADHSIDLDQMSVNTVSEIEFTSDKWDSISGTSMDPISGVHGLESTSEENMSRVGGNVMMDWWEVKPLDNETTRSLQFGVEEEKMGPLIDFVPSTQQNKVLLSCVEEYLIPEMGITPEEKRSDDGQEVPDVNDLPFRTSSPLTPSPNQYLFDSIVQGFENLFITSPSEEKPIPEPN